jgi:hypothetical protein
VTLVEGFDEDALALAGRSRATVARRRSPVSVPALEREVPVAARRAALPGATPDRE